MKVHIVTKDRGNGRINTTEVQIDRVLYNDQFVRFIVEIWQSEGEDCEYVSHRVVG